MSEVKSGETNLEPSFEEMLEESLKNFNTNERVMGTVLSIAPNEVQVDVGRKQTGFIPASELSNDPNARPEDVVKVGDVIELLNRFLFKSLFIYFFPPSHQFNIYVRHFAAK